MNQEDMKPEKTERSTKMDSDMNEMMLSDRSDMQLLVISQYLSLALVVVGSVAGILLENPALKAIAWCGCLFLSFPPLTLWFIVNITRRSRPKI